MPIQSWDSLNKILTDALQSYNELNAAMDLVLFEDAMAHICKINRILESPRGNALLVGVGGSGKQSLSRLAAYISSMEVFQVHVSCQYMNDPQQCRSFCPQVTLRKGYSSADLKADLANLYQKTGLKNLGTVFLMTDAQVADERFLVLINNLLASGEIPDLFTDDEVRKQQLFLVCTRQNFFASGGEHSHDGPERGERRWSSGHSGKLLEVLH